MKRILSILLCMVMLMTCAGLAEEAPAKTAVISDITLTLDGTQYALNPQIAVGVLTGEQSALVDFAVLCKGDALLPVQVQLDGTGISLLLGDSKTAYVLPMELLAGELDGLPADALVEWCSAYAEMMQIAMEMQNNPVRLTQAQGDEMLAKANVEITAEDVTATINGVEQSASHRTYTIGHEQLLTLMDGMMTTVAPDFANAYARYMNATFALTGEELPAAESFSYSALFAEIPMEMTMTVDETVNADAAGYGVIDFTIAVAEENAESVTLHMPMEYTAEDADTMTVTCETVLDMDGAEMGMTILSAMDGLSSSMSMSISVDQLVGMDMSFDNQVADDGSCTLNAGFQVAADGVDASLALSAATTADGNGSTDLNISALGGLYGFACHVETGLYAVENRIAAADTMALAELTEEDPAFIRMTLAAMGLVGDLEILASEESVAPLADMLLELFEGDVLYDDDVYYDASTDPYVYVEDFEPAMDEEDDGATRETPKSIRSQNP